MNDQLRYAIAFMSGFRAAVYGTACEVERGSDWAAGHKAGLAAVWDAEGAALEHAREKVES